MGTSTSNRGQNGRTPLVPSWLDDGGGNQTEPNPPEPISSDQQQNNKVLPDPRRFSSPRSNFTRYINSGGDRSGSLHRAASSYVRHSAGGSQNATMRLGSARGSTARLVSIMGSFANGNISTIAKQFHLGEIIGKSANDVFIRIMNFVCADGGNTDEGIARSAYIEALSAMPDWENKQVETLSPPEFLAFTEIYMADVIQQKIINDIGNKLFSLPNDISSIKNIEAQIKDFIRNTVTDAVSRLNVDIRSIDQHQAQGVVDSVYKTAFDIMASYEEE
ncbi:MAG: Qat anti-phage system associated protein QatB [Anaerovoracaceae bacterium]